jgi:uncharacterized membrane protein YhaH (DUF805 family)
MDIANLLFKFDGRVRRLHYWLAGIGAGLVIGVFVNVMFAMSGFASGVPNPAVFLLLLPVAALDIWISLALGVKRCHDRNKSGLFLLIGLIPLIGGLWLFVELGFLDGTPGPNKYGPSPKGSGETTLTA